MGRLPAFLANPLQLIFILFFDFFRVEGSPIAKSGRKDFVPRDHECLNFRGGKFSKSRGAAVDVPCFLSRYDPEPLRFYRTATAPEAPDTEACPFGSLRAGLRYLQGLLGGFRRAQ